MLKKDLIKVIIQFIVIFLFLKHIDEVISAISFTSELFKDNATIDKTLLLYFLVTKIIYLGFLMMILFLSRQIAQFFVSKDEDAKLIFPFEEKDTLSLGLILITGFCMIDSFTDIISESFYYFQIRISNEHETLQTFQSKNIITSIIKLIISALFFNYRASLNKFIAK